LYIGRTLSFLSVKTNSFLGAFSSSSADTPNALCSNGFFNAFSPDA